MKIIVTGATGFVGNHLVQALLERGHEVTAMGRDHLRARSMSWFRHVKFVPFDMTDSTSEIFGKVDESDLLVHLAWSGLPNYRGLFHFEQNLPASYGFLKAAVVNGHRRLMVVGTCFEYGMQQGCMTENHIANPFNPYGLAKDTLRRFLEVLQSEVGFELQWCRLFYIYGKGQNPNSVLSQLDAALQRGDREFPMSGGEQLRDFLEVQETARRLTVLAESPNEKGIINICSGEPISVRRFVENRIRLLNAKIELKLGVYPYPTHEPFAFWGDSAKYFSIERDHDNQSN